MHYLTEASILLLFVLRSVVGSSVWGGKQSKAGEAEIKKIFNLSFSALVSRIHRIKRQMGTTKENDESERERVFKVVNWGLLFGKSFVDVLLMQFSRSFPLFMIRITR